MHPLILPGGASIPSPAFDLSLLASELDSRVTFARASGATDALYTDASGATYNTFLTDAARVSASRGLLMEEARTNRLLNSTVPVTQTTASLATGIYALSVNGSGSAAVTVGTATITGLTGAASNGTYATFTVSVTGTVTVTKTGSLNWFQLEAGAFPTSLIVTAGAVATRAVDTATALTSGWYLAGAGASLLGEWTPLVQTLTASGRILDVGDGTTSNNRLTIGQETSSGTGQSAVRDASTAVTSSSPVTFMAGNVVRSGMTHQKGGAIQGFMNGVSGPPVSSGLFIDASQTKIGVGCPSSGGTTRPNVFVRRLAYWPVVLPADVMRRITSR